EMGPNELVLDTQIYLKAIWDFCATPAYPFVFADLANEMQVFLDQARVRTGDDIAALGRTAELAASFAESARQFDQLIERARVGELDSRAAELVNAASMRLNQLILPVTNCATSPFHTDGALPQDTFPGLVDLDLFSAHDDDLTRAAHEREIIRET